MEAYERISEDTNDISSEDDFDISVEDDYDVHKERVHLIDKQMSISFIDTIDNARRFIFAEDLVSCIALEFHGLVYNTKLYKKSEFFFNPYCETIRHAARIIRKQISNANSSSFELIVDLSKTHKQCYEIFVDAVVSHFFQKGLKAGEFLYFCVYVSELAAQCYRSEFEEVLDLAVYAILDAFGLSKGRRYELINFAKAVAHKSDQSFNQENQVEIFGINLGKLKEVDISKKREVINDLKLSIYKSFGQSQENELEECGAALEQLNLVDKCDKCEVLGNFEFSIDEIVEKLTKSVESNVNDSYLSFCKENCCISLTEKIHDGEYKNVPYPTEDKFNADILQEVLSVANFEASLFSAIYASSKNEPNTESQDDSHSTNTKDKLESSTCSSFQNIWVQDSYSLFKEVEPHDCVEGKVIKEVEPHDCVEGKVRNLVNASITPNSGILELEKKVELANTSDTLINTDVKFPNAESKVFILEQKQFNVQRSADSKVTSSIAESEKADNKGAIVDYNTKDVENNLIEKETKTFKEAAVISNSEFKKEENANTPEDFSDTMEYENSNVRNIELEELDTVQHPLTCENPSENNDNKLQDNFKQLECKSIEDLDGLFDNIVLPVDREDKQTVDFFAIYKSEGEINEENLKVLKGDTILFAEDLFRYIMKEFYGISYSEPKFDGTRCFACNAFNETVKEVLNFIHDKSETLNRITFDIIANVKEHNTDCYRKYVASVLSHYVVDGLNSDAFLYFCLHFSELAAKFYSLDHPEILDFAICSILDAFCLFKDDWCEFKVATEKVLEILKSKTDHQCTGCKIHCFVDNFEMECVNVIIDTLKTCFLT